MKKKFVALLICAMFYPAVEAVKNAETANAVRNSAVNNTDTGIDPAKQPSAVNNTTPETAKYPSSANNTEEAVALAIELPTFAELHRPFGESDKLAFLSPAKKYYPQTWFHFIGGNVAKKGVTADLEAIAAAGISGVQFFHGQFGGTWPGMDNKQIACLSPQWEDILQYTAKEARRLGLNFTMQNCPGWSMSGGPWITPENSMRHLVFSRTDVEGDKLIDINLPKPQPSNEEWRDYKDVTVLAFPTPEDDTAEPLKISSVEGNGGYAWNACLDSFKTISLKPSSEEQPHVVEISFDKNKVVRTVEFSSVEGFNHAWCFVPGVKIKVEAVDEDGKTTEVLNTDMPQSAWQDGQPISLACNEKILDISPEETVDMIKTAGKKLLDMLSKVTTVLDYAIVADTDIFLGNDSMLSNIGFNMTLPDFDPSDNDAKAKRMEIVVQMRDMFEEKASKLSEALENATSTYIDLTGSDLPISFKWGGASKYRISIWNKHDMRLGYIKLYSGARHHNYETEAGWNLRSLLRADVKQSQSAYIPSEGVVDISAFMDKKNGNLKWDAPKGNWTIIRTGHINTGKRNGPAPPEGTGWECDKLAENGPNLQFANYIGRLADGALSGGLLGGMLLDSWECNTQTWTDNLDMEVEFERQTGYALRRWLPAVFGYVVDNPDATSRFLRDWRGVIGSMFADRFYGRMAELAHQKHLTTYFETAAGDVFPADILEYHKYADVPMCEYWQPINESYVGSINFKPVKPTTSAARLYGKPRVAAEALTSFALTWDEHFEMLKEVANINMTEGVTHSIFHTYTHNPRTDWLPPGTAFGSGIGTPFLRGQTWWKAGMPEFTRYLARCGYMLERGRPVSDILWYLGDEINHKPDQTIVIKGYKYDYCNHDILLNRLTVKDGLIVTPEGLSYRVLWMPDNRRMLPETLAKILALVREGATIVGNKPEGLATLKGGDVSQQQFDRLVSELWNNGREYVRKLGKGTVISGIEVDAAMKSLNIMPDVIGDALWLHRNIDGADWYFISTLKDKSFRGALSFRNSGNVEIWDPVTGAVFEANASAEDGRTSVQLALPHAGSCFVVFRHNNESASDLMASNSVNNASASGFMASNGNNNSPLSAFIASNSVNSSFQGDNSSFQSDNHLSKDDNSSFKIGNLSPTNIQIKKTVINDDLAWNISFPAGYGAPPSLKINALTAWKDLDISDEGKAFSGTAVYTSSFELDNTYDAHYELDLGRVEMLAKVSVNGKQLRTLWTSPYSLDITEAVRKGKNSLKIEVTSTWFNRLVYDANQPETKRKTWTISGPSKDAPLRESGLLGPVKITRIETPLHIENDLVPLPILGWHGLPASGDYSDLKYYEEMAEAGFTVNMPLAGWSDSTSAPYFTLLENAQSAGIKIMLTHKIIDFFTPDEMKRIIEHPAVAGYYIRDEPSADDFADLAATVRRVQAIDNVHPCYINLFPNYASEKQLGTPTYRRHVRQYINEVPVPMVSYDHYCIESTDNVRRLRPSYYENLEIIADESRQAGKPFWAFALSTAHWDYPVPDMADLRLQVYSDLAYGAQCIQYFTWLNPCCDEMWGVQPNDNAPIRIDGTKSPSYYTVQAMNKEIKALSKVFLNSKVEWTAHTGKIPQGCKALKNSQLPASIKSLDISPSGALVSLHTKGKNQFLIIVNHDINNDITVKITGNPSLRMINKAGAVVKVIEEQTVTPGDIIIIVS